jgi:hypothetical protein
LTIQAINIGVDYAYCQEADEAHFIKLPLPGFQSSAISNEERRKSLIIRKRLVVAAREVDLDHLPGLDGGMRIVDTDNGHEL